MKQTDSKTLAGALRVLARDIHSDDGVANACIAEAADRIDQLRAEVEHYKHQAHGAGMSRVRIARQAERIAELEERQRQWLDSDLCGMVIRDQEREIADQSAALAKALEDLRAIRESLQFANDSPNGGINDTIWMMHGPETLFDFIDATIDALSPHDDCSECKAFAPTKDAACRKCKAATPAFSDAVDEFMKGNSK